MSLPVPNETIFVEFKPEEDDQDLMKEDVTWLEKVRNRTVEIHENISRSAFHASHEKAKQYADISSLLPIWRESSKSPAMIKHAIRCRFKGYIFSQSWSNISNSV